MKKTKNWIKTLCLNRASVYSEDRRKWKEYCVKSRLLKQPCMSPHVLSAPIPDLCCDSTRQTARGHRHAELLSRFANDIKCFRASSELTETEAADNLPVMRRQAESGKLMNVCGGCSCFGCLMSARCREGFFTCSFSCSVMSNCDCCTRLHERVYIHRNTDYFFFPF